GQHRPRVRGVARGAYLAHRRARGVGALLAQGVLMAGGPRVTGPGQGVAGGGGGGRGPPGAGGGEVGDGGPGRARAAGGGGPGGAHALDPTAFWKPFMDQGMAAWAKLMSQGPASPELMGQWKQFVDQWIAAWARVLEQAMGTDTFAQMLGKQLETFLNASGP